MFETNISKKELSRRTALIQEMNYLREVLTEDINAYMKEGNSSVEKNERMIKRLMAHTIFLGALQKQSEISAARKTFVEWLSGK